MPLVSHAILLQPRSPQVPELHRYLAQGPRRWWGGGRALHGVFPHQTLPSPPGDVNVIQPNYTAAARDFLQTFRSGLLGPVMLDRDMLHAPPADP